MARARKRPASSCARSTASWTARDGRRSRLDWTPAHHFGGRHVTELKTGILLWSQASGWPEMTAAAERVDQLGYDHLWTWDHLYAIFGDPYQPIVEGWMALAGWAMATERTRLGLLVGANTFRNPGLTAKLARDPRSHQRRPGDPRHRRGVVRPRASGPRHRLRVRLRAAPRLDGRGRRGDAQRD